MLLDGKVEEADTWESSPREKGFGEKDERFAAYNKEGEKAPRKYEGVPVSLQLVGRRYREGGVLGMAERIWRIWWDREIKSHFSERCSKFELKHEFFQCAM
jgi:hypothetical protein